MAAKQYRVLEPAGTQQRAMQQAYGQTPSEGSSRHTYQPQYAHHQPQQHSSYQALPQAQLVFQSPTQQSPQQQPQYNTHLYNPSRRPSLAPRTTLSSTEYRNEPSETMVGKAGLPEQRPPCGIKAKFKDEDDQLLRKLKEDYPYLGLTWKQISDFFPGRSAGTLQVRYCTKIRKKDILWNDDTVSYFSKKEGKKSPPSQASTRNFFSRHNNASIPPFRNCPFPGVLFSRSCATRILCQLH